MAASSYLLELDQRREKLLSEVVDRLGIPAYSAEHEVATSFSARSLANHDHMDAEAKKVEDIVCGVAEKFVMRGDPADATRLLLLSSGLTRKRMRLEGHSMSTTASTSVQPPLEHPFAALALVLALSGTSHFQPKESGEESLRAKRDDRTEAIPSSRDRDIRGDGELTGLGGESSRLWSTDSEGDAGDREEQRGTLGLPPASPSNGSGGGAKSLLNDPSAASASLAVRGGDRGEGVGGDGGTREWLQDFAAEQAEASEWDSDGEQSSAHTDVEGCATSGSEPGQRTRRNRSQDIPISNATDARAAAVAGTPSRTRPSKTSRPTIQHNYGAPCVGADIRSITTGGRGALTQTPFLRPCQTLEASQQAQPHGLLRRRSVPEAEIVRAALHMLQGLAGDIFVRAKDDVNDGDNPIGKPAAVRGGGDSSTVGDGNVRNRQTPASAGKGSARDDGRYTMNEGGRSSVSISGRFALSDSAADDLAVASLSQAALTSVLQELVELGSVAEYLRRFVADAEASGSVAASTASLASHGRRTRRSDDECKHGHATQAFTACVKRQLEGFEDVVAQRDRFLYRRQRGLRDCERYHDRQRGAEAGAVTAALGRAAEDEAVRVRPSAFREHQKEGSSRDSSRFHLGTGGGTIPDWKKNGTNVSGSGETILGLLTLLRKESRSLAQTQRLVMSAAGWWVKTSPGQGMRPGDGTAGGLRQRTAQLLTTLHDSMVEESLVWGQAMRSMTQATAHRDGPRSTRGTASDKTHENFLGRARKQEGCKSCGSRLFSDGSRGEEREEVHEALAPCRRHGWRLQIFCEVLAPYLRLVDSWITEGKISDPHGELFFSQIGVDSLSSYSDPIPSSRGASDADPVVNVWDKGIVLHSNGLPLFLAPFASAMALAGQDISLMKKVRALVANSSHGLSPLGSAIRSRPRLTRRPSGIGTGMARASENFSLATTLFDSMQQLAVRVNRAQAGGDDDSSRGRTMKVGADSGSDDESVETVVEQLDLSGDDDEDKEIRGDTETDVRCGDHTAADPAAIQNASSPKRTKRSRQPRVRWMEAENDDQGSGGDPAEDSDSEMSDAVDDWDWDDDVGTVPASVAQAPSPSAGAAKAEVDERTHVDSTPASDGELVYDEFVEIQVTESRHAIDDVTGSEGDDRDGGGGGPAVQPGTTRLERESSTMIPSRPDETNLPRYDERDARLERDSKGPVDLGFFGGSAQLALRPAAMLDRGLHPAVAPPTLPSIMPLRPDKASTAAEVITRPRKGGAATAATETITSNYYLSDGTADGLASSKGDAWQAGGMRGAAAHHKCTGSDPCSPVRHGRHGEVGHEAAMAAAAEDVAGVLPPTIVLDTCLLRPIREHCRLASSSCLGVFVNELRTVSLAGVLRSIYLAPAGAKSDAPLARFRGALFGLLGALTSSSRSSSSSYGTTNFKSRTGNAPVVFDGMVVRDVPAFLQDSSRLTALLQSSLAASGTDVSRDICDEGGWVDEEDGGDEAGNYLRVPVVGGDDRPLLEYFSVECHPERGGAGQKKSAFPLTSDGRCVDLRVFSCLQVECRLPWPLSVAIPPRSIEKYGRTLGLVLRLEYTAHVIEEAHVLHSHSQRDQPAGGRGLDKRHLQQTRLFAFLRVARAVRSYTITQALVKPWSEFLARLPQCGSLRAFIDLHEAYLDLILGRCFLHPRSRQTLAYLLDALQTGIAFSQRYGEYVVQLKAANGSEGHRSKGAAATDTTRQKSKDDAKESLGRLDGLWDALLSSLGFVIPLLKEMVRSRSGLHVNELLTDLDFNLFFDRQEAWRRTSRR